MKRLSAASEKMFSFTCEGVGDVDAAFRNQRLNEISGDQYCRVECSAVSFHTTCDVYGIANHCELKPLIGADVALHNLPPVNADGNANELAWVVGMSGIPLGKAITDSHGTKRRVCCVPVTGKWWAEHGHETVPKELVYRTTVRKYGFAEHCQQLAQKSDHFVRCLFRREGGESNNIGEQDRCFLATSCGKGHIDLNEPFHDFRREKTRQVPTLSFDLSKTRIC